MLYVAPENLAEKINVYKIIVEINKLIKIL